MRTRSTTTPGMTNPVTTVERWQRRSAICYKHWWGPQSYTVMPPVRELPTTITRDTSRVSGAGTSSITDEVGPDRSIRSCNHTKSVGLTGALVRYVHANSATSGCPYCNKNLQLVPYCDYAETGYYPAAQAAYRAGWANATMPDPQSASESSLPVDYPDQLAQLPARILSRASELELMVSAVEARELPKLWKMFQGRTGLMSLVLKANPEGLARFALRAFDKTEPSVLKKLQWLDKSYRNAHLGTVFGIMPTVRDAVDITTEIRKGVKMKRHKYVVSLKSEETNPYPAYYSEGGDNICRNVKVTQTKLTRRVDGAYVVWSRKQYNTEFFNRAADFLDRYVSINPVGSIWAVLPLSFAIDWILAVDDVLDSLWLSNNRDFSVSYWSSTKAELVRTVTWLSATGLTEVTGPFPAQYTWDEFSMNSSFSSYKRWKRESPNPLESLRTKGASVKNLYLALLIAMGLIRR